jgi:uncharacterized protein (DUF488 family)
MSATPRLYTVGHSDQGIEDFLELLSGAGLRLLVDVRRFPSSKRCPWFAREPLTAALAQVGIEYRHEVDLGGHRRETASRANAGLPAGFLRAYADHLRSPAFRAAEERLRRDATRRPTAVMCAELDPARCHRSLLADQLAAHGLEVVHLLRGGERRPHLPRPGSVSDDRGWLSWPDREPRQLDLWD